MKLPSLREGSFRAFLIFWYLTFQIAQTVVGATIDLIGAALDLVLSRNLSSIRSSHCLLVFALLVTVETRGQAATAGQQRLSLQAVLDAAQSAQAKGDISAAESGYRAFLTRAQLELGGAYALARDADRSDALFDGVMRLSHSPGIVLEAARAGLLANELARAARLSTEVIAAAPTDKVILAGAHQVLGSVLLKQEKDAEARKHFEIATALDPTFQNGYDLAVTCLNLGDEACAVRLFEEMRTSLGDTAELHLAFGKAYGNSDFQQRAIREFELAIAKDPRLPGVHYLLAAVLLASGTEESARSAAENELNTELTISPKDPLTFAALGQIALVRRDTSKAIDLLQQSVAYGPSLPEGYLYLGQAYFDAGQPAPAQEALRTCIQLTGDESRNRYQVQKAHYLLGRILAQQGNAEAAHAEMAMSRELANKALKLDKTRLAGVMATAHPAQVEVPLPDAKGQKAIGATRNEQAQRAAQQLEIQLRPALADAYNNLGAIIAGRADYTDAAADFRAAAQWNPALEGLDYNWGRAAFAANLFAEAIPPLTRYAASHPQDQGAYAVLAISRFKTDDFQGCLGALQRTADVDGQAPQIRYIYAVSLVKTGRLEEGLLRLRALLSNSRMPRRFRPAWLRRSGATLSHD